MFLIQFHYLFPVGILLSLSLEFEILGGAGLILKVGVVLGQRPLIATYVNDLSSL